MTFKVGDRVNITWANKVGGGTIVRIDNDGICYVKWDGIYAQALEYDPDDLEHVETITDRYIDEVI